MQVSLQRALPANVPRRPTVQDIAVQLDAIERGRLSDLTHFLHSFSTWHREVHKWLQSTARSINPENGNTTPGKLSVNAIRGQLQEDIRKESLCERMVQSFRRRQLIQLAEFW